MQEQTVVAAAFTEVTRAVVSEVVLRNEQLPPTEAIKITTMAGCAAVTKK
jgi:ATP-binding protein involved in chromosome partitioning